MNSMTGFGRSEGIVDSHLFTVEIKSVNHRYLDTRFRLPNGLSLYENLFLERLRAKVERGAFDVVVKQKFSPQAKTISSGVRFALDETAFKSLLESWLKAKKKGRLSGMPSADGLIFTNRVFVPIEESTDLEGVLPGILSLFDSALSDVIKMRNQEGERLCFLLKELVAELRTLAAEMTPVAAEQPQKIAEKLKQRLAAWDLKTPIDSQRLESELALYAERSDVTEELHRLATHCEAYLKHAEEKKGIGRKLDFLTQELQREINTLSAKAATLALTQLALKAKGVVEKLREQVQNVE